MQEIHLVKTVDDLLPDHIGWRLWDAAACWKRRFSQAMIEEGHAWYGEARSSVLPYVSLEGTRQSDIVARMGLSKQAVQQLIVDLEQAGIVQRDPDPQDGRGKIVRFTEAGLAAQRDSAKVKRAIENEIRAQMGNDDFEKLFALLKTIGSQTGDSNK